LVVVDQFEELFRYEPDETDEELPLFRDEAQAFANLLLEAARTSEANIYVLITMRSDFFGECGRYRGLAETVSGSQFLVPRMVREQLQEAITRPLCVAAGIPPDQWPDRWPEVVEPALLQRLLNAVGDEATADPLPVMQHALMRAWQMAENAQDQRERSTPQLRVVDYVNAGEIAEALSRHADEVLKRSVAAAGAALPGDGVAHLFRALTDIDREGRAIRRPQTLAELAPVVGTDIPSLMTVLDAFRGPGVSFLTPYMPTPIDEATPIDISHEALIRRWTRISDQSVDPATGLPRGWVQQEFRDGLIWRALVVQAEEFGRNPQACLDPATLGQRYPWFRALRRRPAWALRYAITPARRTEPDAAPEWLEVRQLLLQSLRRKRDEWRARRAAGMQRAEEARKEAVRQAELTRQQELAEAAGKLARERGRRIMIAGIAAIVALLLAAFGGWMALEASRNAEQAQIARDEVRTLLLALQARREATAATSADSVERGGALALESIARSTGPPGADAIEAAMGALSLLPLVVLSHGSPVRSLAVLTDGRLASGGKDGTIKVWPKEGAGEPEKVLSNANASPVSSLAVLADGRLASGDQDGKITVWPKEGTGELEKVLSNANASPVSSLAVLRDGRLASGHQDGKITVWRKEGTGQSEKVLSHGKPVSLLAVLADGRLASGDKDGTIKLWPKGGTGEPVVLPLGGPVYSLAVRVDGRLASGGDDGTIKLWPKEGTGDPVVLSHGKPPYFGGDKVSLAVLANGGLASGGDDGTIKLWPKGGTAERMVLSHGSPISSLAVLPDGRLASAGDDGKIKLWPNEGTGEPVVLTHGSPVYSLAVLADERLASGDKDGKITVWPKEGTGEPVVVLSQGSAVWSLAVLADGRLAGGGHDGKIKLWPKEGTGEPVVLTHGSPVRSLAVLTDGRLASGGNDGKIKFWSVDGAGEPVVVLSQGSAVWSLAVLADGRLASDGNDGKIKFWSVDGAGEPEKVLSHDGSIKLAALADGRLASGDKHGKITVWPKEGAGDPVVLSHGSPVYSLAVLADGRLASGGSDGTIKLWPTEGRDDPVVLSPGSSVYSLAVLADGRLASGSGYDGTINIWLVNEQKLISALCLRPGRNLTKNEWARYIGSDAPRQPSCRDLPSNWRTLD
jgi:WD40 repeat protein